MRTLAYAIPATMQQVAPTPHTQHRLRNGLTLLAETLLWALCLYAAGRISPSGSSISAAASATYLPYSLLYICAALLFPANTFSRTARRDEVAGSAVRTALVACILCLAYHSCPIPLGITFLLAAPALTLLRMLMNGLFARYCTLPAHREHAAIICHESAAWQQQALQRATYGLQLTHLPEVRLLEAFLAEHPETKSVYCDCSILQPAEAEALAHTCRSRGITLHLLPLPTSIMNMPMQAACRGDVCVLSPASLPLQSVFNRAVKRLTDILISLFVLLTIFPPFALVAFFCIKRQSRGPVLIAHRMCGMNGRTFLCPVFRTRHHEAAPSFLDDIDDPGYFPFGRFLKHSRLEFLPQFLCVLLGSMTVVGSQAMRPDLFADYRREQDRLLATGYQLKAGITSHRLAQQEHGSVKADVWYFRNWSFWLDVRIMLQRIGSLLSKSKARTIHYL